MSQDQAIVFLLPNGNTKKIKIQNNDKIFYRNISKELELNCPEEFVAVYDQKLNRVISKFYDKLESNTTYKLFYMPQAVSIIQMKEQQIKQQNDDITKQNEENQKLKDEINNLKSKQDSEIKKQQVGKNQQDLKINELNQKIKEIEPKLEEAQNKIKEQQKDLESARYDLKNANSKQDVWKLDMEKQLFIKSTENQELTNQCMRQANEIQALMKQSLQEKQNFNQFQESFNSQFQQVSTLRDQWQQYAASLDYEKKQIEQGYQELIKKIQDQESEAKKLKKKFDSLDSSSKEEIEQLSKDKQNLEEQIIKLKKDVRESENKYQEGQQNQIRQLDEKQQEILHLKVQLESVTQKLTNQINRNKQMTDDLEKAGQVQQNNGLVKAEEIQKLQRQIQQELGQNEKLTEEKEGLENKITDLTKNLNNCQNLNSDLNYKVNNLEKQLKTIQDESKQDLNKKQEKIEKLNKEISDLLKSKEEEFKELINKQEEENKQSKIKLDNSEKEISRLKEELAKVTNDKKIIEEEAVKQRQNFLKQISDCDTIIFKKEQELVAIQNLAIVPTYQFRIQRLVEQVPREYCKDIEFAIESMMLDKVNPETFLKDNQAKCQQLDFKLSQLQLLKAKAETTLYNISDQDYRQCANMSNIGNMTGILCSVPVNSSDQSLDRYFIFKCVKCPERKQFEGKIFGIKQCKKQDNEELETKETAIDNCLSTIIAQDFMKKFTQELNEKKIKPEFDFQFRDQYIIETKKDFKQYLQEQIQGQQLMLQNEGIKNYVEFIEALSGEQSNEFYDYTREYQLDKKQPKDGNIMLSFLEVHNEKKLQDIYKKFKPENIRKELNHFIDYIGGNLKEMPQKLFYNIQQIEIQPNFQKYNGGHMKFDASPQGKFLSAFTYYSIVKSQRQLCISHLQGVKNQIYDPLVSTYDGFLDKMDQGYNEIRTVESKFLSEPNVNKGIDYLKALGIKWN